MDIQNGAVMRPSEVRKQCDLSQPISEDSAASQIVTSCNQTNQQWP